MYAIPLFLASLAYPGFPRRTDRFSPRPLHANRHRFNAFPGVRILLPQPLQGVCRHFQCSPARLPVPLFFISVSDTWLFTIQPLKFAASALTGSLPHVVSRGCA